MGIKGRREESGESRDIGRGGAEGGISEGGGVAGGYRRRDSEAYEPRPKRIWVMACEVWERVA